MGPRVTPDDWGSPRPISCRAMASIFNLNHHASYAHWHFFQMSVSNIVVVALMFVVFVAAILAPFPSRRPTGKSS
jgi:hypothetical protein